jgi:phosphoglycolate phosphatase-like HAD superfamily hydrolase
MSRPKRIFLDLDGPLLDGKDKHYHCYQNILEKFGFEPIDKEKYWRKKKNRINLRELLSLSGAESIYNEYLTLWLALIESAEALSFDKLQNGAMSCLKTWKSMGVEVYLVTMRRNKSALEEQLNLTGIKEYINALFVSDHAEGGAGKAKVVQGKFRRTQLEEHAIWIGDTEADWDAAQSLGCNIYLVANGLRSTKYLSTLQNCIVFPTITEIAF